MSLSMTFIRWILSHIALILVLSLVLYSFWNWNELLPQDEKEKTQTVLSHEQQRTDARRIVNGTEQFESSPQNMARVNASIQASENKKSFEKHAIIEPESKKKFVYPGDIIDDNQTNIAQANAIQRSVDKANVDKRKEELIKPDQERENLKSVLFQDKELQEQITARQKKLSSQMVSLMAVTMNDSENDSNEEPFEKQGEVQVEEQLVLGDDKKIDIVSVKPVIETPEQRQLLVDARQAFEERNFTIAEEKYLQLMNLLPEFPDIAGELANVYKAQKRQTDYIAMNTRYVKRLSEHNRFNEAWRVVSETTKIDKKTANKQRRIINKKQKELGLTN